MKGLKMLCEVLNKSTKQSEPISKRRCGKGSHLVGFIGPLPRPIKLLDDKEKEGKRPWALPSPLLNLVYKRNIVSPFLASAHLQENPL